MIQLKPPFSALDFELLYRIVAWHEAGHLVQFDRFGIDAAARLEFGLGGKLLGAITVGDHQGLTSQELASVGWVGLISESINSCTLAPQHELPALTASTVADWVRQVRSKFRGMMSNADWAMVVRCRDPLAAAETAFKRVLQVSA